MKSILKEVGATFVFLMISRGYSKVKGRVGGREETTADTSREGWRGLAEELQSPCVPKADMPKVMGKRKNF